MDVFDKIAGKAALAAPDFTKRLTRLLAGERLLAHCRVVPGVRQGGEGSIAAAFSRDGDPLVLSVSDLYLTFWDFGATGEEEPSMTSQLPRRYVASFAGTGERDGDPVARMAFTDGSFLDWRLMTGPGFLTDAGLPSGDES
ncbi:hypothetical protein [Phytomonospora endophytica]|uniref:Uncharacterized protein n=1 Tax=Phytomonospora endophytica TaxID=714109 RepID=A0A841FEZ0_9ACTN|nr:hypothetical protein [Phytomonospora endophytica]MBB6034135.1 hypothetical protein [Phytomonospora endophytica]GIG66527.1 hypothetical protein Pen01_28220 [Phytomonospora endophytica]